MNNFARTTLLAAMLASASGAAMAQAAADPVATDTRVAMDDRDDGNDFPWGLLGLVGLAGLMGRKRENVVVRTDDRVMNDSIRR